LVKNQAWIAASYKRELDLIKVLIVDDHALVRLGIRRLLEDVKGIKVMGEAESGEQAIQITRSDPPDVVLLDINMPGIGGLETTKRLVRIKPDIRIIAVTAFSNDPYPSRVLQAGASGYLTKECSIEEMTDAIKKVFLGQKYLSPEIAQQMALKSLDDSGQKASPFEILSERELQIMLMITSGLRVQEISEKLHLSTKTVNSYRYRLFDKLGIRNDVELTHLAMQFDLLDKPSNIEGMADVLVEEET